MASPKKKLALAILAAAKPDKFKADEEEGAEEEMDEGDASKAALADACRAFYECCKRGDFEGAADACMDMTEICTK